ncbi:OmpP1/FadL family transporter [Paracoccus methylarcula]|uniref:Aromatic hydrocarbon degradation protein n=1 Tax=Paracoccus methylarcula TaxID=72022 RepID=A0A3R7NAL5_9RHOB|nr:outer membrane protein transport protein [Paracoccus methylarcula]RNF33457.1 aromatic hydrocarbon degradation protein [Paracoccus methylarcula]
MKYVFSGTAALLIGAAPALAGGIERGGQFLGPLWEPGNYAEFSFGHVKPSVDGVDKLGFKTGSVANSYNLFGMAYKHQFNDSWSAAIILDQPIGADIDYPDFNPVAGTGSAMLGGTSATVDGEHLTGIVRFKMPENGFGVHAGIRAGRTDANVTLSGAAYGPVSGYNLDVDRDTAYGWLAGVSWERPDIAARVALTYNSSIEHDFDVTESGPLVDPDGPGPAPAMALLDGSSTLKVESPKSWNLEFQTGVDPKTLVFGSIRWVDWSSFQVNPEKFVQVTKGGLVDLEDTTTYTIGVGRKFTENWSGAASFIFEKSGDDLVSPLAPTNGKKGITLAAIYTQDKLKITTGVSYYKLGDAMPETGTPDTARADMEDNHVWGVGVKVGYSF